VLRAALTSESAGCRKGAASLKMQLEVQARLAFQGFFEVSTGVRGSLSVSLGHPVVCCR
jgi:hypothetical protein